MVSAEMASIGNVAQIPAVYAAATPEEVAIAHFDGAISYAELSRRTNRVANGMKALDVAPQSRVIFLSKNDPRYFELFFGVAQAGLALAPANWRLSAEELTFIIGDSEAPVVFVSTEYAPLIEAIRKDLPLVQHVIVLDGGSMGAVDYDGWRDSQDDGPVETDALPDDDVLQLYTSGTTGLPKGAMLTNANIVAYMRTCAASPLAPFGPGTMVLVPLPLFHVGGACWGLNALYHGRTNLLLREASAPIIVEAFSRFPVTKAGMVPAVMKMVLDHPAVGGADFSHLDTMSYGAAPISPELLDQTRTVFGCDFVQMFGMTESCSVATFLAREDHDPARPEKMLSVGKVAPTIGLRVVNAQGEDVAVGESGEILLSGANIMKGYWRRPDATAQAIIDGWYHTGDVGYLDDEGFLYLRDRLKDMIISGGENVYSAEVERVLSAHEKIAEVAIIGIPDTKWGEAVKAMVVVKPGEALTAGEVIDYARSRMAGFKCPKSVDFIDIMPRNPAGKILKRVLRQPYWQDQARAVA